MSRNPQQTARLRRTRRIRRPLPTLPSGWQVLLVLAVSRAAVAAGYVFVPAFRARLGDATLMAATAVLAALVGAAAAGFWYTFRGQAPRSLLADAIALACLTPVIVVASAIQLADARFGGRAENVLAAMGAVAAVFAIVTFVGASDRGARFGSVALAALPAALSVAAIIGGTTVFAGGQAWQGFSLAWMVSAIATVVFLMLPATRGFVAAVTFAAFAAAMLTLPDRRVTASTEADLDMALLIIAAVGAIVVVVGLAPSGRTVARPGGRQVDGS